MDSYNLSLSYILSNIQTSSGVFHNYNKPPVTLYLLLLPPLNYPHLVFYLLIYI